MNESWVGVWMIDSLKEGKDEGYIILKHSPRQLNKPISETQNGPQTWEETIIEKSIVAVNHAWSDNSVFACVLTYTLIGYDNHFYGVEDVSVDLLEFFKSNNTSKWISRIEMIRQPKTWISCQLSAAMKTKQRNLVAIPTLFNYEYPSVEIYKLEYEHSPII